MGTRDTFPRPVWATPITTSSFVLSAQSKDVRVAGCKCARFRAQPKGELLLNSYTATCHQANSRVCAVPASQYLWTASRRCSTWWQR
jgi:hypothetical protein